VGVGIGYVAGLVGEHHYRTTTVPVMCGWSEQK
jgi:hypothetical protein